MATTRIPLALQKVFLTSNSGNEVNEAPAGNVASKNFGTKWSRKGEKVKGYIPKISWSFRSASKHKRNGWKSPKNSADASSVNTKSTDATDEPWKDIPKKIQFEAPTKIISNRTAQSPEKVRAELSPQDYLHRLLNSRGYSTASKSTLDSGYYATPTRLQQASYHSHLIGLARAGQKNELKDILKCGISPNPCNSYGESLVHTVCRRCDPETLQILLDAGARVQVSDDYGRTPLHDACWRAEPSFEMIDMIASRDLFLFQLTDGRGALPLSYVHKENWAKWNNFLESKKEVWWPKERCSVNSVLANLGPNTRLIQDPKNALAPEIAVMLTAGRITPNDPIILMLNVGDEHTEEDESDIMSEDFHHPGYNSDEDVCDKTSHSDGEDYSCSSNDESITCSEADYTDSLDDLTLFMNEDDMADVLGLALAARRSQTTTMACF